MFEFYELVINHDTYEEKIVKRQYEDTPENLELKERLEREKDCFERVKVTVVDWYYHCNTVESTEYLSLSNSVFTTDGTFVGCIFNGRLCLPGGGSIRVRHDVRGVTGVEQSYSIRRCH